MYNTSIYVGHYTRDMNNTPMCYLGNSNEGKGSWEASLMHGLFKNAALLLNGMVYSIKSQLDKNILMGIVLGCVCTYVCMYACM